jgi:hypothetical protein
MGIVIIRTKEMPIFLLTVRGIPAIIFGAMIAIGSLWLMVGGLIIDFQLVRLN